MSKWPLVRLGDYAKVCTGKLDVNAGCENGKYPFFTCSKEPYRIDKFNFECECVLLAGNGDLNVKYYNGRFNAYQRTYVLETLDKRRLTVRYLYYFMLSYIDFLRLGSIGGVIKYIKLGDITEAIIPLPPLEEQKRITAMLDMAQTLIDLRKKQIAEMDELAQSIFRDMFGDPVRNEKGWEKRKLSCFIEFLTSGSRGWAQYYSDKGAFFITIKNVKNGKIHRDTVQYIDPPNTKEAVRTKVKANDLLISITADLGRTAVVDKQTADEQAYINQHLALVRLNDRIDPVFLASYLECEAGQAQFNTRNQMGVKSGLNFNAIKSLLCLVPPIKLQQEYADDAQYVEKEKLKMSQGLALLEQNFNALMQQAF